MGIKCPELGGRRMANSGCPALQAEGQGHPVTRGYLVRNASFDEMCRRHGPAAHGCM